MYDFCTCYALENRENQKQKIEKERYKAMIDKGHDKRKVVTFGAKLI